MSNFKEPQTNVDAASVESIVHTPGPWRFEPTNYGKAARYGYGLLDSDDDSLGVMVLTTDVWGKDIKSAEANARLIAAAPELLQACQDTLTYLATHADDDSNVLWGKVSAAFRKAKGIDN